jgi:hypothetical protein
VGGGAAGAGVRGRSVECLRPAEISHIEKMPTEPRPVSLADAVRRAARVVDPDDNDAVIGDFERAFEDADEPISALDDVQARVASVTSELDPAIANGSLSVAAAITIYLSYRRDELHADPEGLIRLAARAEWPDGVPAVVSDWLDERGLTL